MWSPRWRKAAADDATADGKAFNSLFGEILDWMLAPLLFLWPISIIVTHNVANSIANQPYDQALAVNVRAIARLVKVDGQVLDLSAREIGLLEVLLLRAGRLVSKEQLVDHLCGWGEEVSNNAIEVYVHRLRKKLEHSGVQIVTMRGLGYCLEKPDSHA